MSDDVDEDVQEDVDDEVEDGQPEIDDEEMADFRSVADEVEAAAGAGSDDDQENDDDESDQDDTSEETSTSSSEGRVSAGDVYCNALGMGAAVARASYGSADEDDRSDLVDEYGDMARDLQIDEYVDQWLDEQGGIDELTPGQAILLSTVMFGGMVAMDDPEMIDGLAGEVGA